MKFAPWGRLRGGFNARFAAFAGGRLARFCRPGFIVFLLTERCNARCLHCDIWKDRSKEDLPPIEEWKKVLRDLRLWLGPAGIVFSGGELLLHPHALDLVRYGVFLGFHVETLTNGYSHDQSRVEALAECNPRRITLSLDGVGPVHSKIRGRDDFFEITSRSLETLLRSKSRDCRTFDILLKTVIMEHNLDDLCEIARFADRHGIQVFYQPIEQNYKRPFEPLWFETSENWPRDAGKAIARIRELIALKHAGLPIANSDAQLESMIGYFADPVRLGLVTRAHAAAGRKPACAAATTLQFQANGDVTVCSNRPPIGNIRATPIRQLWKQRSRVWENGCCLLQPETTGRAAAGEPPPPNSAAAGGV